ncbi:DUF5710 domain-containing protein [Ramlibacter tataouinensis]
MFNQVLAKYSSNASDGSSLPSQTVLSWFRDWWNASRIPPHPHSGKLCIEVPFEQKDRAKAAGARWYPNEFRPWGRRRGVWMVDPDLYFANPARFGDWRIWHAPPSLPEKPDSLDWEAVSVHLLEHEADLDADALNVGSLLIDEGQDFPPAFYRTLRFISAVGSARPVEHPLKCLVLADENQKLTEENSTLEEIARELRIAEGDRFLLLDNFRNTKEVAELARRFFADVGVLPHLPTRSGPKPTFALLGRSEIVNRIRTWLVNNPGKEAGVLVFSEEDRDSLVTLIREKCENLKGRHVTVQTYSWNSRRINPAKDLVFDTPDVVTVLNMQSCKGLEFDAVFILDLSHAQISRIGPDRFKMQMFVAVSRSREWVGLLDSGKGAASAPYVELLPDERYLERESQLERAAQSAGDATLLSEPKETLAVRKDEGWETRLKQFAKSGKLKLQDKRPKGGVLWVEDERGVEDLVRPLGFQYSAKQSAWWRK